MQLQETDQQQMIDTQTVLPASVCAKADKYSFSDFLPRVISYFTVEGTLYAMPFNVSGPVLYYNKKAFTAAGLDPEKPPTTLDEVRAAAEKLKASGAVRRRSGSRPTRLPRALDGDGEPLFANNGNGRKARATEAAFNTHDGAQIFSWLAGMVKDGLAATNADRGTEPFDDLLGIGNGSHAMAIDTSAALGTIKAVLGGGERSRTSSSAWRRCPGPGSATAGWRVQPGRCAVHGEQVGAREAGGGVAVPEVPRRARERTDVGGRHRLRPDPHVVGVEHRDAGLLGAEPRVQGRLRPAAGRQGHRRHARDR